MSAFSVLYQLLCADVPFTECSLIHSWSGKAAQSAVASFVTSAYLWFYADYWIMLAKGTPTSIVSVTSALLSLPVRWRCVVVSYLEGVNSWEGHWAYSYLCSAEVYLEKLDLPIPSFGWHFLWCKPTTFVTFATITNMFVDFVELCCADKADWAQQVCFFQPENVTCQCCY